MRSTGRCRCGDHHRRHPLGAATPDCGLTGTRALGRVSLSRPERCRATGTHTILSLQSSLFQCGVVNRRAHRALTRASRRGVLARSLLTAVIVLTTVAGSTESAFASQVEIAGDQLIYRADKSESNVITISGAVDTYVIRDTGATIRAVAPCKLTGTSEHAASCPAAGLAGLGVDARDANDYVDLVGAALPAVVVGGDGDDLLGGGTGADRIDGSRGADLLVGRGGNDVLAGAAGADVLRGGLGDDTVLGGTEDDAIGTDPGADSLDGGAGFDAVSYGDRLAPVIITLDGVPNDGNLGEGDNVQATVERIGGSPANDFISGQRAGATSGPGMMLEGDRGDDVLIGELGADDIRGGAGKDRISGGPGPDVLTGGRGRDVIFGDAGNDLVDAADGTADTIDCGPGSDSASLDPRDAGAQRCESRVPGGTPDGVSQADIAGFYRFSGAKLRSRRGGPVVTFRQIYRVIASAVSRGSGSESRSSPLASAVWGTLQAVSW